jgi:hypothetical protein
LDFWPTTLGIAAFAKTGNVLFLAAGLLVAGALYILKASGPRISWPFIARYSLAWFFISGLMLRMPFLKYRLNAES